MVEGIVSTFAELLNALQLISIPVAAVALAIAGYQFMRGGDEGPSKAKKTCFYLVIGLVVIWGASAIVDGVKERITF